MTLSTELWPYLILVVAGFLPNEVWRVLGLVVGRGLDEESEIVVLSRAVATAILAGVVAKLILFPSGSLVMVPAAVRICAAVLGFAAYLTVRKSVLAGVATAEFVIVVGGYFLAR